MEPKDKSNQQQNPGAVPGQSAKEKNREAHTQADKDIENDPDLSVHSPNDDLDEGELGRLGEDVTDVI